MKLSRYLKEYRFENNLTQKELADKIGIMCYIVNRIENNKLQNQLSVKTIRKIANATDTTEEKVIKMYEVDK